MQQAAPLMITNEHVNLLSVSGRMDGAGLRTLQQQIDLLLDAGARFLLTDLSRAERCDSQVFDLLTRTSNLIQQRGGWLRLVAPGNSVVGSVDQIVRTGDLSMGPTSHRTDHVVGNA
jgi:anti-anti-sigma regulatory factor